MIHQYRLGHLVFQLRGSGPVFEKINEEFKFIEKIKTDNAHPHIVFEFCEDLVDSEFRYSGSTMVGEKNLRLKCGGFTFQVYRKDNTLKVDLVPPVFVEKNFASSSVRRARDWGYLNTEEKYSKNFLYNIFDWIIQVEQLSLNQTFIHASTVEKNDFGLAVMGWGGVGKTSTMLKMISEDSWNYLSDDLGLVDVDQKIYMSPKKMQIYGYNLIGEFDLRRRLLKNRSLIDRLSWEARFFLKGSKLVRRRVAPDQLWRRKTLKSSANLSCAIFLEPTSSKNHWGYRETNPEELASRMAPIVMDEIEPFSRLAREMESAGVSIFGTYANTQACTENVICQSLSSVRCGVLSVPSNPAPNDLRKRIKQIVGF